MVALTSTLSFSPWLHFLLTLLVGLPLGAWLVSAVLRPVERTVSDLSDGLASFSDRDYSIRLCDARSSELAKLTQQYNHLAELLQSERLEVRQRELLLATALNRSPVAILLIGPRSNVLYSNLEARKLLLGGAKLEGKSFAEIEQGCPAAMREILSSDTDGIFTVPSGGYSETYHLAQRGFSLNRQRHDLILLQRMTSELGRQEAAVWKKAIRVISHELNNSIAPISSLMHSAGIVARQPDTGAQLEEIFATIRERLDHLMLFLNGYARFARLPPPRKESVSWQELLEEVTEIAAVSVDDPLPQDNAWVDKAQLRQLLVNLIKNAVEASPEESKITLKVQPGADGSSYLQVLDRGHGMDEETIKQALLPFYSTKQTGSGLGLPLCREIVEAHGGKLSLQMRPGGGTAVICWLPGP